MITLRKVWNLVKGFILFNMIWYLLSLMMNSRVLPTPDKIYMNLPTLLQNGFEIHFIASLYRLFVGLLISFLIGTTIGLLMGYFPTVNKLLNPLVYFVYPVPKTALLPVVMTIYGLGDNSKIMIIVLSLLIIGVLANYSGLIAEKFKLPSLIGIMLFGMIIGPSYLNLVPSQTLEISSIIKDTALVIVLFIGGLGISLAQIKQIGKPAVLLSIVPATLEGFAVAFLCMIFLDFTFIQGAILGFIIAAVSPAVLAASVLTTWVIGTLAGCSGLTVNKNASGGSNARQKSLL